MSSGSVVRWSSGARVPSREEIATLAADYFGGMAKVGPWTGPWLAIRPIGPSSYALATLRGKPNHHAGETRVIEVYYAPPGDGFYVEVITRISDEVTSDLARAFAARIAGFWSGNIDP